MSGGADLPVRRAALQLRLDPDAGVPVLAYVFSALVHLALLLVVFTWPKPRPAPRQFFVPVRLAAAPAPPQPVAQRRVDVPPEAPPARPKPEPAPEPERPPPEPQRKPEPEPKAAPKPKEVGTAAGTKPPEPEQDPPPPPEKLEPKPEALPKERLPESAPDAAAETVVESEGVSARFEGATLPHSQYLDVLVRKISRSWLKPRSVRPSQSTIVRFEVSRAGVVSALLVEQGSGVNLFDRKALRAVQLASPLPPLPPAYPHRSLKVHFEFIP